MELEFQIPILSEIPDSLSCIRDSKAGDSGSTTQIAWFPDSTSKIFPGPLTWGETAVH